MSSICGSRKANCGRWAGLLRWDSFALAPETLVSLVRTALLSCEGPQLPKVPDWAQFSRVLSHLFLNRLLGTAEPQAPF